MATNLTEEIAEKVSLLPPERQREALSLVEQLSARANPRVSPLPRAEHRLKGATAEGQSISSEEILESRRETWGDYMREDETRPSPISGKRYRGPSLSSVEPTATYT